MIRMVRRLNKRIAHYSFDVLSSVGDWNIICVLTKKHSVDPERTAADGGGGSKVSTKIHHSILRTT